MVKTVKEKKKVDTSGTNRVPYRIELEILHRFFSTEADVDGKVIYTFPELESKAYNTVPKNTLLRTIKYLMSQGYIKRVQVGSRAYKTIDDVSRFLSEYKNIKSREDLATMREYAPVSVSPSKERLTVEKSTVEVEVSSEPTQETFNELNQTMNLMLSFLRTMPEEMIGALNTISSKINSANPKAIENILSEKDKLEQELVEMKKAHIEEIKMWEEEVESLKNNGSIDIEAMLEFKQKVLDVVDSLISMPAWELKTNAHKKKEEIESALDDYLLSK